MQYLIGIDIGGTKCAITLGRCKNDPEGHLEIIDKIHFPTEIDKGVPFTLNRFVALITEILSKYHLKEADVSSIGISCGGPLDSNKGVILSPPNLIGWDNIPIVAFIEKKFGIRTKIQNDANACALAEWKLGAAKGYKHIIFLTFGTGMGAGLILNGKLYSGTNDMAGEVGHIRLANYGPVGYGKSGSFEGFCSGGGIAQLARLKVSEKLQMGEKVSFCEHLGQLSELNAKIVGDAAQAGDALACEIYQICGEHLGMGLSILIDILNPELIVIGSIFARNQNLLWPAALDVISRESLSFARNACTVVPTQLGEKIGDYAALAVAAYA